MIEDSRQRCERLPYEIAIPFKLPSPITMVLEFVQSEMADKAMILPGAERLEDRKVRYSADGMVTIYFAFRTLLALAR
jgi:D-aminopeptidase